MNDAYLSAARAVRWFPRCVLLLAVAACARTWNTPYFYVIVSWSLPAALAALTLLSASPEAGQIPPRVDPAGFAAVAWAANIAVLMLWVPVYVVTSDNPLSKIGGWTYPFLDKRWLATLYVIGIGATLAIPALLRWWYGGAVAIPPGVEARRPGWLNRVTGAVLVLGLSWLAAGPPWNVERHHRPIDFHEQVHLGPLQAVDKGIVPFVGPAATQYGPGSQLIAYGFMKWTDDFSVTGFRRANLLFNFVTLLAVGLAAAWLIDAPTTLLIMVLALAFSPLAFFRPMADGTFEGAYGWGNALRYLGAVLVVPVAALSGARFPLSRWRLSDIGLGVAWGFFAWVAQENLTSTGGALLLTVAVCAAASATTWARAADLLRSMAIGFAMWWLPVFAFYAWHGELTAFIGNYFRVALAITKGFQNTWWNDGESSYAAYLYTPAVVVGIGWLTLWDLRRLDLRRLADEQVRLFAYVSVLATCYLTALYRSDSSHVVNTMIALPFVLALAFRDLPSWTALGPLARLAIRGAIVAMALQIYPLSPMLSDVYAGLVKPSLVRFQQSATPAPPSAGEGVAFTRVAAALQDEPAVAPGSVPMRQFLVEASELHRLIGDRPTFMTGMGSVYTGLVYFLADLTPVPGLLERETMQINRRVELDVIEDFHRLVANVRCLIVRERGMEEEATFLAAYPSARIEPRPLGGRTVYVLLAD